MYVYLLVNFVYDTFYWAKVLSLSKLLLFLKPLQSSYWEFLGINLDLRVFKLPQMKFPEVPKNSPILNYR